MRRLQKIEIRLAYFIPIAAAVPSLLEITRQVWRGDISFNAPRLLMILLLFDIVPVLAYLILGVVGCLAAKRNSIVLTFIFLILLVPLVMMSRFLAEAAAFGSGAFLALLHCFVPFLAIVAALVSLLSRSSTRTIS